MTKTLLQPSAQRWCYVRFYEPFTMGGNLWHALRYPVDAFDTDVLGRHVFVWQHPDGSWQLHERFTGGYLGHGNTIAAAIAMATHSISETPTFDAQIEALGDVERLPAITYKEARRRLQDVENPKKVNDGKA